MLVDLILLILLINHLQEKGKQQSFVIRSKFSSKLKAESCTCDRCEAACFHHLLFSPETQMFGLAGTCLSLWLIITGQLQGDFFLFQMEKKSTK